MTRLPIDYSNTVIYKLVCNDLTITDCYVGHTTDFVRRKQCHKNSCINEKNKRFNIKVYKIIRENGGWYNWTMVEIEKYPCKDTNEAAAKEREWFERLDSNLNSQYPQRGRAEYFEDYCEKNRDRLIMNKRTYNSQYNEAHKEEIRIKKNQYSAAHKEEIRIYNSQYNEAHKEEIRIYNSQYNEAHKEERRIYNSQYNEEHKEEISAKKKEPFNCQCGKRYLYSNKSNHSKTFFHKQYVNNLLLASDSTIPIATNELNINPCRPVQTATIADI